MSLTSRLRAGTQAVRDAAALALAELAAAPASPELGLAAALEAEKRPAKKQQLERVPGGAFRVALAAPLVEAAVARKRVRAGAGGAQPAAARASLQAMRHGRMVGREAASHAN